MIRTADKPPLTATVALVEFDQGPGLRIDIVIGWDRLKGLAQQIRWWSRMPAEDVRKSDVFSDSSEQSEQMWREIQAEFSDEND